jgi:hypothetical protein
MGGSLKVVVVVVMVVVVVVVVEGCQPSPIYAGKPSGTDRI